ncbi:BrnT family toxin [Duganella aceris]|uniref:BrnT family toxin n=1 Tax=Duganella aceris TaxID=2703883 RepID=UPI0035310315
MRFEWDQRKAKENFRKHGISFDEAITVFKDPRVIFKLDFDHSDDEDRYWAIGISSSTRMLLFCHCYRLDDIVRILSARRATPAEMKLYP